jgi:uncharacterized membrane protein
MASVAAEQGPVPAEPGPIPARPRFEIRIVALSAVTVSFVLMFVGLGRKPFWVDEAIAVLPARSILTEGVPRNPFDLNFMAPQLQDGLWDPSAPLYRYSVAAVTAVTGFSETTTRGWSVLLGLLLLLPCYLLFRRIYDAETALVAVAFLAASPPFADLAREARHFTFVACTMAFAFYFLVDAAATGSERSRVWWPVFLTAALLGHAMGYLALPIVAVFLLLSRGRPLWSRRHAWVYGGLAVLYGAIELEYWNTLPFLHPVTCDNQPAGCHPHWYYYLGILHTFAIGGRLDFVPGAIAPSWQATIANSLLPLLLLVPGLYATAVAIRRGGALRAGRVLVLAWLLLPLVLLSVRDVKFPRYVVYVMPPLFLLLARGLVFLTSASALGRLRPPVLAVLALVVVLAPQLEEKLVDGRRTTSLHSRYIAHARETSFEGDTDNWERMRAQVAFLSRHVGADDILVSSLDDASLGYYLRRFVYGFLNSQHDDAFFLQLLARATKDGVRVWFIDTLPAHNYCHTSGLDPRGVDCRLKYRGFYEACRPDGPTFDPTCVRLRFD